MHDNIEDPLTLDELCARTGLSRRNAERKFKLFLGESPMVIYRNIRLDRGRALLVETDMVLSEIAAACGFSSAVLFSRRYKARFGKSPATARCKAG